MRVKVCGITSYKDAVNALDQGVDALGFNFYPSSPRYIDPSEACAVIRRLPPFVTTVGLFVNVARPQHLVLEARTAGVQMLQLHGDESFEYCRHLAGWPVIKALRIGNAPLPQDIARYDVRAFLLDAKDDALFGGTGRTFDWGRAEEIKRYGPIILAGGLTPANVAAAIRVVRPYAVDVCSGVESTPGKKDLTKLIAFMNEVRNASNAFET